VWVKEEKMGKVQHNAGEMLGTFDEVSKGKEACRD
jgi:hypothetical protein